MVLASSLPFLLLTSSLASAGLVPRQIVSSSASKASTSATAAAATSTASSNTCPAPAPLQTFYPVELAHKNARGEDGSFENFGPPNGQGKSYAGQPMAPGGKPKVKNVILTIPDGFGPASEAFARDYFQYINKADWNHQLPADTIQVGSVRTRSTDSYVTDSAAAGTAYACAVKTYNGGIAVTDDASPVGSVLEAAKAQGYKTGLVVTSRITHATPASFASHIYDRDIEEVIASQLIGNTPLGHTVDVLLGGGLCYFQPNTTEFPKNCRPDQRDLMVEAREKGYNAFSTRADFDALKEGNEASLPFLGLFTPGHMSYEVDRNATVEPSLAEMTTTALQALKLATEDSEQGFFIMVEGSRIDHAGHANDLVGHLHDILAWNDAVQVMKDFVDANHEDTVFLGTADHECGGLTVGGQYDGAPEYGWNPSALEGATKSASALASMVAKYTGDDLPTYINETVFPLYGIMDANATEIAVTAKLNASTGANEINIAQTLHRRSMVKFNTLGHSAVDVNLIAYGKGSEVLAGNHDNTEIGQFVIDMLNLDTSAITDKLNDPSNSEWLENEVGLAKVIGGVRVSGGAISRRGHGDLC